MPFPTPDNPSGSKMTLIGLLVHSDPISIQSNVSGAISQLFEEYFFEQLGQMTPQEAAEYYSNRDWIMSICDSIADCIYNSESVRAALGQFIAEYTGVLGPDSLTNPISPEQSANNLLPPDYVCNDDNLMGMARFIISALHDTFLELAEEIEVTTNPFEALTVLVDNVEVVSWLGTIGELLAWLQEQVTEYYGNAYSQIVQDTIACNLWCEFSENCNVSVDSIIAGYARVFESFEVTPPDTNDYTEIINWITTLTAMPDALLVSACHWLALQSLRFRSGFGAMVGLRTLEQTIILGEDETDTSWSLCGPCEPLPETGIDYDYRTGQLGSYVYSTNPGSYVTGEGYAYYNGTFSDRSFVEHAALPSLTVSEIRVYQYRLQQSGYGASPAIRVVGYNASNAVLFNVSGTWSELQTEDGLPYKTFVLASPVTGLTRIQFQQVALNTASVATWRFYGWGYS